MNDENDSIINIDDFIKIDLRVGKIIEASHIEGADKLLSLKLDLGHLGEKNVFAGIKSIYEPDKLKIIMEFNLRGGIKSKITIDSENISN